MKHPFSYIRCAYVRRCLSDYLVFEPAHLENEYDLPRAQVEENFRRFMEVRHERLSLFQAWMRRHFRLNLHLDGAGIIALSRWVDCYGAGLC